MGRAWTPWTHPLQLPSDVHVGLVEPAGGPAEFFDAAAAYPALTARLEAHHAVAAEELRRYLATGLDHSKPLLLENQLIVRNASAGRRWSQLIFFYPEQQEWDLELCAHFNATCALLRTLPELHTVASHPASPATTKMWGGEQTVPDGTMQHRVVPGVMGIFKMGPASALVPHPLYGSTLSGTVWRLYGGAKGLVVWYYRSRTPAPPTSA